MFNTSPCNGVYGLNGAVGNKNLTFGKEKLFTRNLTHSKTPAPVSPKTLLPF